MAGVLKIQREDELALLTISNPDKKNALDPPLLDALVEALAVLPAEGARCVVLTGEGTLFSSGYDLEALAAAHADEQPARPLERAVNAILDGELPVIAALPGLAIGGGCELACACDLRVAHGAVALQMPPVRLGIVYPAAGLRRFVALIGASRTRELFLTAERVDAERALAWGLVDRVVAPEAVLPTARALATAIARGAPLALRGTRRLLANLDAPSPAAAELDELVRAAFLSEDAKEAQLAFRERRPPRFTGR